MYDADPDPLLLRLAAAAVLQRVRWGQAAPRDVPLARPVRVDPDEVVLELADNSHLVIATSPTAADLRAGLRRWSAVADGPVLAVVLGPIEAQEALRTAPPDRPRAGFSAVLHAVDEVLWEGEWPPLLDVLVEAADRRQDPPAQVLQVLRDRIETPWTAPSAPEATPLFERVVFALGQAHDLIRLVRGEALLDLRGGGRALVIAASGDDEADDIHLAHALARVAAELAHDHEPPGLIVVGGTPEVRERATLVLGQVARQGRIFAVSETGQVRPVDSDLADVAALALGWTESLDLWATLEAGLARSRGSTFDRQIASAGEGRLGLVRALLQSVPKARLRWMEPSAARLHVDERELRVRWVGPEGGSVDAVVGTWRMAAVAARWTGFTIDLVLGGGDVATWQRARDALPSVPDGHVFHLDTSGAVHTRAGLLGILQSPARALRAIGRQSDGDRRCTVDELKSEVERRAVADFRAVVADAEFQRKLFRVTPWATRGLLIAIAVGWVLQLRFDATQGAGAVRMGALTGEGLYAGEPWRWIAAAFLHGWWFHIGLNAWALWILGRRLESMLGPHRLVILFLVSCVGGSMLHEAFAQPGDIAVGASTGVLGLLAAQGALTLVRRDLIPTNTRRLLWREAWLNGVIILAISLLPFVGGLAHLGGALAGFFLVATGLLTLGVTAGGAQSPGPTRISAPPGLQAMAYSVMGLSAAGVLSALLIGQPWVLQSRDGRVRDVQVADGRLTVPLPGSAGAPKVAIRSDGSVVAIAGDPLRDGLRVTATATRLGDLGLDLEDIAALRGSGEVGWSRSRAGGLAVLSSYGSGPGTLVAGPDRLQRRRWFALDEGVLVDVEVVGSGDVKNTRLSGTWNRIPAGLAVHPEAWASAAPPPDLAAWSDVLASAPSLDVDGIDPVRAALLRGAWLAVRGDVSQAERALEPALPDPAARTRCLEVARRLAWHGHPDAALLLVAQSLTRAGTAEQVAHHFVQAEILEGQDRFEQALASLDDAPSPALDLTRAQLAWHAGHDDDAKQAATRWLDAAAPWWTRFLGIDDAGWQTNRAWASFLAGDTAGCIDGSRAALRVDEDDATAAFNLGLCALAQGDIDIATSAYRDADATARELDQRALRQAAARDLRGLVRRDVPEAGRLYREIFPELESP